MDFQDVYLDNNFQNKDWGRRFLGKVESRLNFNFLRVINYGISEIYVANIVLQKHFSPDPCLIDKGTTVLGQNISHKQQKMFKISPIV